MNKFTLLALKSGEAGLYDWLQTLQIQETSKIKTLGIRKGHLKVNPNFWNGLKEPEQVGVLLHEVLHLAFEHEKVNLPNHKLANIAEDIIINETLISVGYVLPPGGECRAFYGVPAELRSSKEIYYFLEKNAKKENKSGGGGTSPEEGNSSDGRGTSPGEGNSSDGRGTSPREGNSSDGEDASSEKESNSDWEKIAKEIAGKINEKARQKKTVLQIPTVFPWEQIILSAVGRLIRRNQEGSYSRPSRFRSADRILHKGLRSTINCPKVNFYIDCSGSMNSCLATVAGKILKMKSKLKDFSPSYWGFADSGPFRLDFNNLHCGGGTSFSRFVEDADLQIIITDGEFCFDFLEKYQKRFIIVTNNGSIPLTNKRGTIIKVDFEKM